MEAISIQRFLTLPSCRSLRFLFERVSGALVAAPVARTAHPQGHPEPESGAHTELRVLEAGSVRGRCGEKPSSRPWSSTAPQPGPRRRRQGCEEASSRSLRTSPREKALSLSERRGAVRPPPRLRRFLAGDGPGVVQVHIFSRELLRRFAKSGRPSFLTLSTDLGGRQPLPGQGPDRREGSEPGAKPGLCAQPPEAQETLPPQATRQSRLG